MCVQTIDTAVEMIAKRNRFNSGADCLFFRVDDDWGFKFFPRWNSNTNYMGIARQSLISQRKAAKHKLAPIVGEYIEFPIPDNLSKYGNAVCGGYYTKCIQETLHDFVKRENPILYDYHIEIIATKMPDYAYLMTGIYNLFGEDITDTHSENCGYLPDGTLVYIDFAEVFWSRQ